MTNPADRADQLAVMCLARYDDYVLSGGQSQLQESIHMGESALGVWSSSGSPRPAYISNVAILLRELFELTDDREALQRAVALARAALEFCGDRHDDRPTCLYNLGLVLTTLAGIPGTPRAVKNEAMMALRKARKITPEGHRLRRVLLQSLFDLLQQEGHQWYGDEPSEIATVGRELGWLKVQEEHHAEYGSRSEARKRITEVLDALEIGYGDCNGDWVSLTYEGNEITCEPGEDRFVFRALVCQLDPESALDAALCRDLIVSNGHPSCVYTIYQKYVAQGFYAIEDVGITAMAILAPTQATVDVVPVLLGEISKHVSSQRERLQAANGARRRRGISPAKS